MWVIATNVAISVLCLPNKDGATRLCLFSRKVAALVFPSPETLPLKNFPNFYLIKNFLINEHDMYSEVFSLKIDVRNSVIRYSEIFLISVKKKNYREEVL